MNMLQFDKGVWLLHRRLAHRFVKFFRFIREATQQLEDYQLREAGDMSDTTPSKSASGKSSIVCLLSSDSSSNSDTEEEDGEEDREEDREEDEDEDEEEDEDEDA